MSTDFNTRDGIPMDDETRTAALHAIDALIILGIEYEHTAYVAHFVELWLRDGALPDYADTVALCMVESIKEHVGDTGAEYVLSFASMVLEDAIATHGGEILRLRLHVDELISQLDAIKSNQPKEA